jgi:uncharacterized protein (DUF1697 family)
MTTYVAFLRGINVGGHKTISMKALSEHLALGGMLVPSLGGNKHVSKKTGY